MTYANLGSLSFIKTRIIISTLTPMIGVLFLFAATSFGQQNSNRCVIRGQIYDNCSQPPKSICAAGGPLIIRLRAAGSYWERWQSYSVINDNLHCRGIGVGFFGAASAVTRGFSVDLTEFGKNAQKFLDDTSKDLALLNASFATELINTGKLKLNSGAYLTNSADIDKELVRREQQYVENALKTSWYSADIIRNINSRTKWHLDYDIFGPMISNISAISAVRSQKRRNNLSAEFDYGNINDRLAVGILTSSHYRK